MAEKTPEKTLTSVGQTVLYLLGPESGTPPKTRPAIVIGVGEGNLVDLTVFTRGDIDSLPYSWGTAMVSYDADGKLPHTWRLLK